MRESDSTEIENAMAAAISPDATDKEIRNLAIENYDKASRIYALTGNDSIYDYAVGSIKYSGYVNGSVTKNRRLEEAGGGSRGPEYLRKQKKGTEAIQRLFPGGVLANGVPNQKIGFQTLNEYDATLNESLLDYELNHSEEDRKKSQAYRLMKSYAIDAHVRRRIEDLNKKKKQKG